MSKTYGSYLKVDELLELQQLESNPEEHDELLFIIIHQTYELWFKQILHESGKLRTNLNQGETWSAAKTLRRILTIMKTLVGQVDILETMTPMSFTSFRDRLETSSGFQSTQFREFEFILGYKRPEVMKYTDTDSELGKCVLRRLEEPSVVDAFYDFLEHHGVTIPGALRGRDTTLPAIPNEDVQNGL